MGPVSRYLQYVKDVEEGKAVTPVPAPKGVEVLAESSEASNEIVKRLIGVDLLSERFLVVSQQRSEPLLYEVTNPATREVRCLGTDRGALEKCVSLGYDSLPAVLKLVSVKGKVASIVSFLSVRLVREIVDKFILERSENVTVDSFGWKDEPGYCLKRMQLDITLGPTPCWDQFVSRCDEPKAVLAWVWSVFEKRHVGRQALYLKGQGMEGKTQVINVLASFVGLDAAAVIKSGTDGDRFSHSEYFDKRLLAYPDCRFPSFVKSELFRNYSSGDLVSVEFKYMQPFTRRVYARIVIGANFAPNIDSEKSDRSRLLIVNVAPLPKATDGSARGDLMPEAEWLQGLRDEMPHFLHRCRAAYDEVCEGHAVIRADSLERHDQKLASASEGADGEFEAVCDLYGITFGAELECSRVALTNVMRAERMKTSERTLFRKWLEARGMRMEVSGKKDDRRRVWRGLSIAADAESETFAARVDAQRRIG